MQKHFLEQQGRPRDDRPLCYNLASNSVQQHCSNTFYLFRASMSARRSLLAPTSSSALAPFFHTW